MSDLMKERYSLKKLLSESKSIDFDQIRDSADLDDAVSDFKPHRIRYQLQNCLDELINNPSLTAEKEDIFKAILCLSIKDQKNYCWQALEKNTSLGKRFWSPRPSIWNFYQENPTLDNGLRQEIKAHLKRIDPENFDSKMYALKENQTELSLIS